MTYEFKIDIGLYSSDKFEALEPLLPYIDFESTEGKRLLELFGSVAKRSVLAYLGCSNSDLRKICEIENLPYVRLRKILNDSKMAVFDGYLLILSIYDEDCQLKLESELRHNQPYTDYNKAYNNRESRMIMLAESYNLYPMIISEREILNNISQGYPKYLSWNNEQENNLWIMSQTNLPKLKPNDWHYRIYLNDRMLIERVMMPGIPLDRKVWQEQVSFSKIPADGFNFRLETSLNIQFDKVDLNGIITQPMDKSFSVNP